MPLIALTTVSRPLSLDGTGLTSVRSEEHTSELQSRPHLVCRLLLEKKNKNNNPNNTSSSERASDTAIASCQCHQSGTDRRSDNGYHTRQRAKRAHRLRARQQTRTYV